MFRPQLRAGSAKLPSLKMAMSFQTRHPSLKRKDREEAARRSLMGYKTVDNLQLAIIRSLNIKISLKPSRLK